MPDIGKSVREGLSFGRGRRKRSRGRRRKRSRRSRGSRTYIQVYWEEGKWKVRKRGNSRASSTHRKKKRARKAAHRLARKNQPAQIIVRKKNGRIQSDHTIPKKSDPFPPRG